MNKTRWAVSWAVGVAAWGLGACASSTAATTTETPGEAIVSGGDPCVAGLSRGGLNGHVQETWQDVILSLDETTADEACAEKDVPCGPDEAVSLPAGENFAVVTRDGKGGYLFYEDAYAPIDMSTTRKVEALGELRVARVDYEMLGHSEECNGEGECMHPTVSYGHVYNDLVFAPDGRLLWTASCDTGEDGLGQAPVITRSGANTFTYRGCATGAAPVTFTPEALARCDKAVTR